jgi:hypothetical protein
MSTDNSFKVYSNIPAAKMREALSLAKLNNLQLVSYQVAASVLDNKAVVNLGALLPGQVIVLATAVVNDAFTLVDESSLSIVVATTEASSGGYVLMDKILLTTFPLNQSFNDANNAPYVIGDDGPFINISNSTTTTASSDGSIVVNFLVSNSAV